MRSSKYILYTLNKIYIHYIGLDLIVLLVGKGTRRFFGTQYGFSSVLSRSSRRPKVAGQNRMGHLFAGVGAGEKSLWHSG